MGTFPTQSSMLVGLAHRLSTAYSLYCVVWFFRFSLFSTEELFQTKLEIFETQPVQESDKKEYRSNIRKASSIIEAMHWYYLIVNDIEMSTSEKSEEKIPENIDILLADISSETLFKYKLQLFEKEEIQNSENKKARSKLRKATNLIELFSAYNEVILLDKKE